MVNTSTHITKTATHYKTHAYIMFDFMKVEVKVTPEQSTKAQMGSRCIALL